MKKMSVFILALILIVSLSACGRGNRNDETMPSADTSGTDMTILPDMNPTIDTNIPDPNVDTQMPIYTDGTDATENTAGRDSQRAGIS